MIIGWFKMNEKQMEIVSFCDFHFYRFGDTVIHSAHNNGWPIIIKRKQKIEFSLFDGKIKS